MLDSTDRPLRPASNDQNATYWYLRSQLVRALAQDWERITLASPATLRAQANLDAFTNRHPSVEFRVFRPEDGAMTVDSTSRLALR